MKSIYSRFKVYGKYKNLQTMILVPFTAIGLISILIMSTSLFFKFTNTANKMVEKNNIQILEQTNQSLNSYLKQMMKVSDSIYYQILKQKDVNKNSVSDEFYLLYSENQDKIFSITLFDRFGQIVQSVPVSQLKKNMVAKNEDWFRNAEGKIEEFHFSAPHVQNIFSAGDTSYRWVVSLSRYVEFVRNGKVEEGVLLVDMNFSGMEQVLKNVVLGNSGYLYLMDRDGEFIYHPQQQLLYAGLAEENNKKIRNYEDGSYMDKFHSEKRMITVKTVGYTGWKLVGVVPMKEVSAQYSDMQAYIVIFSLILVLVFIQLSHYISKKISDPILRLEKSVEKLENGNLDAEIVIDGSEEIRHLGKTIRSMVKQLKKLMADIVTEQELKRKSELEALQTQINPHFLYNTLDSIVWMIENQKTEGAVTMVTALARFFRISISKGKSIITVKEELAHAEYYMSIQSVRYKNKFSYKIEAEEEVKDCITMKLILQPMIENAINHGMAYMDERDGGCIRIKAFRHEDQLWLEIIDNGCGMTKEETASILEKEKRTKGSGIGIVNVHERVQIYFGKEYGVQVFSEPDEGTCVRIIMPYCKLKDYVRNEKEEE